MNRGPAAAEEHSMPGPSEHVATISVIVPVYHQAATVAECMAGLDEQKPAAASVEVIFVDNGSTDGSVDLIASHGGHRLVHEQRRGAYIARNKGVAVANGEILAFIDPDCIPCPEWLAAIVEAFRDPRVSVVLGTRRPFPDRGLNRLLADYETAKDRWMLGSSEPEKYYGYTNNMAVRREAWERCGPFLELQRGADTLFVRRVVDTVGTAAVQFVPRMRVSHLEIDGPLAYFRKVFIYGRSHQAYRRVRPTRPLSFGDRFGILTATMSHAEYGALQVVALFALLVLGMAAWACGRLVGMVDVCLGRYAVR